MMMLLAQFEFAAPQRLTALAIVLVVLLAGWFSLSRHSRGRRLGARMRGGRHGQQHRALPTQPHTKADAAEGAGRVTIIFREAIGGDDGAVFTNDPSGGFVNDNGADANRDDFMPGEGGWVVDPPKMYSGDDPDNPSAVNWLTPGARNHGQSALPVIAPLQIWFLY